MSVRINPGGMDSLEGCEDIQYGPLKATRKQKQAINHLKFREANREKLRDYKREYDSRRKKEMQLGREMLKIMEATKS
jgi:hypothetical protein